MEKQTYKLTARVVQITVRKASTQTNCKSCTNNSMEKQTHKLTAKFAQTD